MNRPFSLIYRITAISLAALLLLSACGQKPTEPTIPTEPHVPCHEPFEPVLSVPAVNSNLPVSTKIEAVFKDVEVAPTEHFTYEDMDGGIRLTAYRGEGSKVILPDTIDGKAVVALGDGLFRDNTALSALAIPESVTEIGADLLTGCRSLQVLRTPQLGAHRNGTEGHLSYFFGQTTPLGTGFRVPSMLDTVILLDTVTAIPDNAFLDCSRLQWVVMPDTVTSIGAYAFSGCSRLNYAPIPTSLQTIGERAFEGTAIQEVTLPSTLKRVGAGVFANCLPLWHITLPFLGESRDNQSHLGYLFGAESYNWNSSYLSRYLVRVTLTEGDVPDYAFYGCDHLELVELAKDCTSIGVRAFYGCSALQSITMPDSLTAIGDLAFAHCTTLAKVTLSEGLTALGLQAFIDCTNLTELVLPDALTALPPSAFADCCNLQTLTLGKDVTAIGAQSFRNCVSLTTVTGGKSDMTVGDGNELFEAAYQ